MKVNVECCWSGGDKFTFRLTTPDGQRVIIPTTHCRWLDHRKRALDILEFMGYKRRSIRFTNV